MKSKIMVMAIAAGLAVGLLGLVRRGDPLPPAVEPSAPASPLPVRREARLRATAPDETPPVAAVAETNEPVATNLYARLANGEIPRVRLEQLETYLTKNRRSVDALLGALRASGEDALLQEAKEKYPNDPRVQFAAALKTDSPEERRQWLEKFKHSDPGNALPDYLVAAEHFKSGQTEQALQVVSAAATKPGMEDYLLDFMQNAEEAYVVAGVSSDAAKAIAATTALLPELAKLKQVGVDLMELAKRYQQAGDESSAQNLLEMGMNLGRRLGDSPQSTLIHELVGMAIQRQSLNAMNPNAAYGETGQTVQDQINALDTRRTTYKELTAKSEPILRGMSDQELAHYFDRVKLYGDMAARRWVINQAPQQQQ